MRINFAFAGVLKCKRDRKFLKEQCPVCDFPVSSKGRSIVQLQSDSYTCTRPWIHPHLKQRNFTLGDSDYISVSPEDFVAPLGMLEMNMTDQFHNDARIVCNVQRPTGIENLTATFQQNGKDLTALSAIVSTSLICNIDYDDIRQIWNILATYSDSPMRLERGLLLSFKPDTVYAYKQVLPTADDIFTEIEAKIKANPEWLMQGTILLQLDRVTTTFPTLIIKYLSNVQIDVNSSKDIRDQYSWAMIRRDNQTKTEHSVLAGGVTELNCQAVGDPKPIVEWILPDGSKLRAPYNSEDQRIVLTHEGRLTLKSVEISDTGVYHCITTNYQDADVLAFRVTVLPLDTEEEEIKGNKVSHTLGQDLLLDCTSASSPQASIQWILPDHTVLDKSYGNRELHKNGTLVIHELTSRDTGFYRCLAGNFLGADMIAFQVTVHDYVSYSTRPNYVKESGDQVVQIIDDSQKLGSRYLSQRVSEESRSITSGRPYTWLQSRFQKVPTRRRGNGRNSGRVFNKKYKKEGATFIRKSQIKGGNKKTVSLEGSKTLKGPSDDNDITSGDGISEDEFIVMTTTQTLKHKPVSTITIKDIKIPETYKTVTSASIEVNPENTSNILRAKEKTNLVEATSHSHSQTPATPIMASYTLSSYETTPNTNKSDYRLSHSDGKTIIYERATNRPLGNLITLKPSLTEVADLQFSGDSEDVATGATPLYNFQGPNATYLEPKSQTILTAVTTTEQDREKITFQTTQRIKSELLPGSTIISKHQIQIVPSKKMQSGKRRNFHGRRRIIRPSKITDIQSLLDKFKHLSINKEYNLTFSHTVDKITDCEYGKRVTSGVSTDKCKTSVDQSLVNPTARYHMPTSSFTVTEKPVMATHLSVSGKTYTVTDSQMATTMVHSISEESSDYKSYSNAIEKELTLTTTTTSTSVMSSKTTKGKIPWHRPFGHKGELKETHNKHQNPFTLSSNEEQMVSVSTTETYKAKTAVPTTELQLTHIVASPPVTRQNINTPETSFDDSSGSSSFTEIHFSDNVITPSTTPEFFSFPASHKLSTTTESLRVSHSLAAPPTMRSELKKDTGQNNFSGSQNGLWGNQKPGYHRRGSRRRRPIKKTTTKPPIITVTKIAGKLATTGVNMRNSSERGWRFTTQRPTIRVQPTIHEQKYKDCSECPQPNASGIPRSRTVTSYTMIDSTANTFTPFPYSSSTANAHDNTRYDTSSIRDITSKPRINGGKAASFTVLSNSDAFLPCNATGNPEPIISWNRFSSTTGTKLKPQSLPLLLHHVHFHSILFYILECLKSQHKIKKDFFFADPFLSPLYHQVIC